LADVESGLVGKRLDSAAIQAAARAAGEVEVRDGVRASKAYRQRMAPVVVGRALARALGVGG
jgi:CO/xanthine dehydrogenase FAD-binding subunit